MNAAEKALAKAETIRRELIRELKGGEWRKDTPWWTDRIRALNATTAKIRRLQAAVDGVAYATMA